MNPGQSWRYRKARLRHTLEVVGDDDEAEGIALDEYLSKRPKSTTGRTTTTLACQIPNDLYTTGKGPNIDSLRFSNRDLATLGALAQGPFGTVCTPVADPYSGALSRSTGRHG
jgi:hypothetical protein